MVARTKPAESSDPAKDEPEAAQPTAEQLRDDRFVRHLPHAGFSARLITKTQWESIGVVDQETVEWNEMNMFSLPISMFTDRALDYLLKIDDGFKIVER